MQKRKVEILCLGLRCEAALARLKCWAFAGPPIIGTNGLRPSSRHKLGRRPNYFLQLLIGLCALFVLDGALISATNGRSRSYEPAVYEHESFQHQKNYVQVEYKPAKHDYYDLDGFFYHWWNWFWCNLVLIIIVGLIVWLIFRLWYGFQITNRFAAAAAGLAGGVNIAAGPLTARLLALRAALPL